MKSVAELIPGIVEACEHQRIWQDAYKLILASRPNALIDPFYLDNLPAIWGPSIVEVNYAIMVVMVGDISNSFNHLATDMDPDGWVIRL